MVFLDLLVVVIWYLLYQNMPPLAINYIKLKMMTRRLSVLDIAIIIVTIIVAAIVIYLLTPLITIGMVE